MSYPDEIDEGPLARRWSEDEETMLLRRALAGDTARATAARLPGACTVEVHGVDGCVMDLRTVPPEGLSIGRAADQDIRLSDRTVSRHHCRIDQVDGRYFLDDSGSLNDTLLDGEPVHGRAELHDGAKLTVGLHELLITIR